ncbi:biliverdin-producing heme oxygenase [Empedobacter sedimenti]|uniref:biliverdin-producing heme oxygenase n=1 Tax=Empedobacter sedimenti TaxID=3042610 RepID=UPI0024A6ED66|nr:biliverdin-producing heme oxygenase [Empedobacter sedimenti]
MLLSELLKTSTANYHDEIEGKLASKKLFDGTFTDQDYYKMLQVNHLFLEVYEKDIRDLLSENDLHNFVQTNLDKLSLIEKDLNELSLSKLNISKKANLQNRAEAIGALYVIEGSMLGGNVIAKTLKKYPDLADQKFNYFGHYGENLGQSWKTFVSYINEEFTNEEQQKQVLEGAKKAYEDLISFA